MKTDADLLDVSYESQRRFEVTTSLGSRKERGQYFTPKAVCSFMARLISRPGCDFRLLDPGAGVGSLTSAVCEEFRRLRSPRRLEVHLFENDVRLIDTLARNMAHCRRVLENAGHALKYYIHPDDFLLSGAHRFPGANSLFVEDFPLGHFDAVITNPPYFKIRKTSDHARLMADIVHGQPNIYALFLALAAHLLRPGGELVAITPRSFCNGLYFRDFRRWFLARMSLERIHLFESRTETFKDSGVLQESVISLSRRSDRQSPTVQITTSVGRDLHEVRGSRELSADRVIDNSHEDCIIQIPADGLDQQILDVMEALPQRFAETGLRISTGPVVMFRAEDFLLEGLNGANTIPLLLPHNVRPFETVWPVKKGAKPIAFRLCPDSRRLALPAQNYVLVKRFSAKEERRRLTAGCFFKSRQNRPFVAVENHLNYLYHGKRELTEEETFGIAAILNSILFDRYFRVISGNTQVNATELRAMRFPHLSAITKIGKRVKNAAPFSANHVEQIVVEQLSVPSRLASALMESIE